MAKEEDINESVKFALKEIKDQYKTYVLDSFDDMKKKNQILLLICSLLLTLPLSNEFIVGKIISSDVLIAFFVAGVISLSLAIVLLVISLAQTQVKVPMFEHILNSIGKYKSVNIIKAVAKTYANNMKFNREKVNDKRNIIKIAEKFILFGIFLIVLPTIVVIIV